MDRNAPVRPPGHLPDDPDLPGQPLVDAEAANSPVPPSPAPASPWLRALLGLSLVLIALNLRPVFSSLSALLPEVMRDTGLQPGAASLMTTLPVLCMGLFAPLAPRLAARFGAERVILALMAVLTAGTALRTLGTIPGLLAGAGLAGASIAVINVLLPGLVKRDFPDHVALMTGLFTMALCGGAAAAAGLTVPLEQALHGWWAGALGLWAVPVLLVAVLWGPQALRVGSTHGKGTHAALSLRRSPLAWQVTLFMGLQSLLAYCVFGYLAPILRERGMDAAAAGAVVSFSVVFQCFASLVTPTLAVRLPNQRLINVLYFVLACAAFLACMFAPLGRIWLWAALQGFGQGGLIALSMTAIVLRSTDIRMAARLSSMAQSVGYGLASIGPLLVGLLRGWTGSYSTAAVMLVAVTVLGSWCAYGAGRAIHIGQRPPGDPG